MSGGKRRKKRSIHAMTLNLAPLIDINANLLFFLIVANSVQEDRLKAGKDVDLPSSTSKQAQSGDLVSVVVSLKGISVNEKEILTLNNGEFDASVLDPKTGKIVPLHTELSRIMRDMIAKGAQPGAGADEDKLPIVFIQADRRLPYASLYKVMRTGGEAGFTRFRFAAKSGGGGGG